MRTTTAASFVAFAAALLSSTAAAANLLTNSNFDDGANHWTWAQTTQPRVGYSVDSADGFPASPSLAVTGSVEGDMYSECIVLAAQNVDLFASAKIEDPLLNWATASVAIDTFSDSACLNAIDEHSVTWTESGSGWSEKSIIALDLPDTTNSVLVVLKGRVISPLWAIVHFDSVRFGPAGTTPVTLQSFDID